jgi:hypothetical protein
MADDNRHGIVHRLVRAFVGLLGVIGAARAAVPDAEPPSPDGPPAGPEHPSVQYERTDVRLGGVLVVIVAVGCLATFHYWIVWWFFNRYNASESAMKRSPYPLAPEPSMKLPAEPRLEQLERTSELQKEDVYVREKAKETVLNGLGPTDEPGYVHIPIRRAMALVVGRLPGGPEPPAGPAKNNGLLDHGEPNSGRLFRGERR